MTYLVVDPNPPEIEALLAVEGDLQPEPSELRTRAVERARAALTRSQRTVLVVRATITSRTKIAWAVAAAVLLFAFGAIALHLGYRLNDRPAPPAESPKRPAPAVQAPRAVLLPESTTEVEPALPLPPPRSPKARPAAIPKTIIDTEAYAVELKVLQPAQRAVARRDFTSALETIAEHQHRFPSGQLAEEREALRVKALLGLGRTADAQRAGTAFRERFPRSALLGRIDEMLGMQR
jgi:hypothetical protein